MFFILRKMPSVIHIVLFGGVIIWTVYFMLWPFMAVIFYQKFKLSILATGFILSVATFISIILSICGGYFLDKIGNSFIFKLGLLVVSLSLVTVLLTDNLLTYVIMLFGISAGKGILGTTFKTIIANEIRDAEVKKQAFYWFYFCINVGGALGPFFGVTFTLHYPWQTFLLLLTTCVGYAFIAIVF